MVVATGRNEGSLRAVALRQLEAQHPAIKIEGARQVGDLEVDVSDANSRVDGRICFRHPTRLAGQAGKTNAPRDSRYLTDDIKFRMGIPKSRSCHPVGRRYRGYLPRREQW